MLLKRKTNDRTSLDETVTERLHMVEIPVTELSKLVHFSDSRKKNKTGRRF